MSFRFRYLLLFYVSVLTFLLTAAIVGLYTVRFQEQAIADLTEYGKTITTNTSFTLANDLFMENYAPLQEFVEAFSSQLNVRAIEISDEQWNILAATELKKLGTHMREDAVEDCLPNGEEDICVRLDSDRQLLVVTAPIVIEDLRLGRVRVSMPMQKMLDHVADVQRQGLLAGFLCWLLAVLLGFFVMHRLTHPVRKFVEATESISRGEFDVDLPAPKWVVELEKFAEALRVMTAAIASREQELRESEKKFRHLFERALEGIFVADGEGQILDVNPAVISILGAAREEELLGRNLFVDFFPEAEQAQRFKKQIDASGFVTSHELEMKTLAGITIIAELSCHAVSDQSGTITAYEGMIRDITIRKGAEQEITRMRNYLTNIIESMPSVLVSVDENGIISQWNSAAAMLIGVAPDQALGRRICDVAPFFSKYSDRFAEIVRDRHPLRLPRERFSYDGEREGVFSLTLFPLVANGNSGVAIRLDDITELDAKEQQLRQAQKMESVGTLAGGLAHDFNNVLGSVLGNLSLVENRLEQDGAIAPDILRGYLERMNAASNRAVDLVRQLLTLSRRQDIDLVPVDLNLSVKHVMKICETTFDKSVRIVWLPAPAAANVLADPTQIEQVVLNLCINAAHAMTIMRGDAPWGGVLAMDLDEMMVDEAFQRIHPEARPVRYWRLTVSDNGVGMEPAIIDKVFDPFFTTKEKGVGTGLGLAMAYNIVTQLGGFLDVYSEVGMGSTLKVYLPRLDRKEQAEAETGRVALAHGRGVVLVVDDDQALRDISSEMLETIGYRVLLASDGREGVELYRQNQGLVAAVLLDMVMPVMSGKEAYLEMKKINSEVKVVLTSGFRQDERIEEVLRLGVNTFLQKPYTMEKLGLALQEVIAS